ncbi:MAG: flagellar biosynthesis protein FlgL [Rhodospirillales bacterium]|nr:flagellar biosynthesis protein FlgL [Rhodospirillales bacterium]
MTRVSTYGQLDATLTAIMRQQSALAEAQAQSVHGQKSETYTGIGNNSQHLLNLENQIARSMQYVEQGGIVDSRIATMYDAVGSMVDSLASYQSLLSTALGGNEGEDMALNYQAQSLMDSFVDAANTRLSGRYLFAGDLTDTAPVDLGAYPAQTYPSTADESYYQGDDTVASFKASDNKTIIYGATADEAGFEQAIRALSLGVNASEDPLDEDAVLEAYDLVNSALDALLVTQTKLSAAASTLDSEMDIQTETQVRLEAVISDIEKVDLAEALSRAEALQTQLEASYSAISRINELKLSDYL